MPVVGQNRDRQSFGPRLGFQEGPQTGKGKGKEEEAGERRRGLMEQIQPRKDNLLASNLGCIVGK